MDTEGLQDSSKTKNKTKEKNHDTSPERPEDKRKGGKRKISDSEDSLLRAQKYVKEKKRYKCDKCGMSTLYITSFESHQIAHTQESDFTCYECMKPFPTKYKLERHQESHDRIVPLPMKASKFKKHYGWP